jgi:phosphoglycerate dehydrogenase-like enzyme
MIASPLEPELAARVGALEVVDELLYAPELVAPVRYPNDHGGDPAFALDSTQQGAWDALLARADVLFGYPSESSANLVRSLAVGTNVRFVQGTSAGMGAHVKRANLDAATLDRVRFASAAGVHGGMLAEFAFYGLLALRKDARRLATIRAQRSWEHYAMGELDGSTIGILGTGQIGDAIAKRARGFGMRTIGIGRTRERREGYDETAATSDLGTLAPRLDALAITLPATELTIGLVSAAVLDALPQHAVLINVGRGSVADQPALIEALRANRLAGAVLDVFAAEPLPPDNPLWDMPNVVMAPHTAALSLHENARIIDLFCDNLRRFARGEPLRNALNLTEYY